jgi:hypothetical protein
MQFKLCTVIIMPNTVSSIFIPGSRVSGRIYECGRAMSTVLIIGSAVNRCAGLWERIYVDKELDESG